MATTTNNGWSTPDNTAYVKDGASAIRTLGSAIDTSVGTGLLAWTAYTPSLSGMSLGNGTLDFKYCQLGKTVHVRGTITLGSTSTVTGPLDIGCPVVSTGYVTGHAVGNFMAFNNTTVYYGTNLNIGNNASFRGVVSLASGTYSAVADLSSTIPFTWANTHDMFITYTYQAA